MKRAIIEVEKEIAALTKKILKKEEKQSDLQDELRQLNYNLESLESELTSLQIQAFNIELNTLYISKDNLEPSKDPYAHYNPQIFYFTEDSRKKDESYDGIVAVGYKIQVIGYMYVSNDYIEVDNVENLVALPHNHKLYKKALKYIDFYLAENLDLDL